jgi:HNH endonuclease
MKCIWCKQNSDSSKSVEHILPESLGNQTHTLPRGWVCDQCNNYFSRKIEQPFLESYYGRAIRFEATIPNKKGRVPPLTGIHFQSSLAIEAVRSLHDGSISIGALKEADAPNWIDAITQNKRGTLILPTATEPENNRTLSRFIAKVALEVLASKCIEIDGWNDEIVNQLVLEEIRQYVRFNKPSSLWPIYIRKIYPHGTMFTEEGHSFGVLNEWTILVTRDQEYFAVIAIFGIEYSINLGGPELDGYISWLQENDNKSPLYWNTKTSGEPTVNAKYFI